MRRGEGRGVGAVLGRRDPVGVDRPHMTAGRPRLASGGGSARPPSPPSRRPRRATRSRPPRRRLGDDRDHRGREPREVVARLAVVMSMSCFRPHWPASAAVAAWRSAIALPVCAGRLDVLGARHPGVEAVVDEEAPDLLVGDVADELLDVDSAVAERAAFLVGLGDLRLEGDDALEARLEVVHSFQIYPERPTAILSGRLSYDHAAPMAHRVTLIPGDGTGPELAEATRRVLDATGVEFDWDVQQAGADVMDEHGGNPLPDHVLESIKQNGVALKGPITTPVGTGFRCVNVALRKTLDLYGQVRPVQELRGRPLPLRRASTSSSSARTPRTSTPGSSSRRAPSTRARSSTGSSTTARRGSAKTPGISLKPISITGTRRIVEFAFDYARQERPPQGHRRAQGEHHEVHRRPLPSRRPRGGGGARRTSSSRTGSWTTSACSSCSGPRSTTSSSARTSTATSSPTSAPA